MFSSISRRIFVYITFWSIVFIAFYFLFWRSSLNELNKESDNIDKVEQALIQMQKYIEDWPITAERELREAEENLEDFLAKIPDQENIPEVLRKVQEYGIQSSQLNLKTLENITKREEKSEESTPKKEAEKEEEKYAKSTYKLAAQGNYFDVMKFLQNLETMERLINIETFSLKNSGDAESIDLDLTFDIFYSKPQEKSNFSEER